MYLQTLYHLNNIESVAVYNLWEGQTYLELSLLRGLADKYCMHMTKNENLNSFEYFGTRISEVKGLCKYCCYL